MPKISAEMVAGGRTLGEPRLSPDGQVVAFVSAWGAMAAIVVVSVDGGAERIVTTSPQPSRPRPLGGGCFDWLPDGSAVVYAAVGDLWLQPILGGPARRLTTQPTDQPASAPSVAPHGKEVAYVVDERHIAAVSLEQNGQWPRRISGGSNDFALDPTWSADGDFIAWQEWNVPHMPWDESSWVVAPATGSGPTGAMGESGVQIQQPRFAPVGSDLAYLSDRTGWLNLWVFGPDRPGEQPVVDEPHEHATPTMGSGQRSFAWSPDGMRIAFNRNEDGFGRLCIVTLATGEVTEVAKAHHGGLDWKGDTIVAIRTGGRTPHQIVTYSVTSGQRRTLAHGPVMGFEAANLPEPTLVTHPAHDGTTLHARLYSPTMPLPQRPMICWIHGGPTDQWPVVFNPRIAWWLDQGWSILVPDHRGSTGHGRAYTQAMAGRWGELDTADVAAAIRHAKAQGWSDRIAIMGGSAGGFNVLNTLADHPGLCLAGVALYPVTDLISLAEGTHRFEAHYTDSLVGPLPAAIEKYRGNSPLTKAALVTTPTLILHGTNDNVVPLDQSQQFVAKCHAAELHVYEGEGHGWRRNETTLDEMQRVCAFLDRHVLRYVP
jgi:dipeptidyl aminopeptidase/acylaminoacyl peptidase